jgi:very-short-patch-repair endonuclease
MTTIFNRNEETGLRRRLRKKSTEAEKLLWQYLRNEKLNRIKFRRQYSVNKYILDFYSPLNKLAVELDGEIHLDPEVKMNDEIRENYIKGFGIKIIRIKNEMVLNDIEEVLKIILNSIDNVRTPHKNIIRKD